MDRNLFNLSDTPEVPAAQVPAAEAAPSIPAEVAPSAPSTPLSQEAAYTPGADLQGFGASPAGFNPAAQQPFGANAFAAPSATFAAPGGTFDPANAPLKVPPKKKKNGLKITLLILLSIALFAGGMFSGYYGNDLWRSWRLQSGTPGSQSPQTPNPNPALSEDFEPGSITFAEGDEENRYTPAEVYANCVEGVVGISTEITSENIFGYQSEYAVSGSGFIISADGYILTNCHVVEGGTTVTVSLYNGNEYEAKVIGKDSYNDIAVLKIDADEELTVLSLGKSSELIVGEEILVIGNPLGELNYTLTRGIVSNLSREIVTEESEVPIRMFQTDAAINSGNSGGPAIDCHGNVIGVVSAKYASSSIEGLGFCIPIDDARVIAQDLIQNGYVKGRPYLGITCQAVSGYSGSTFIAGVQVQSVAKDGCAEAAGLKRNDIITALGDVQVTTVAELTAALFEYKAGDSIEITFLRGNQTLTVTGTLGELVG